jgi:RNA polymerase sigma-70 factor (ECF subfamily)
MLEGARSGETSAAQLFELVYEQLRALAGGLMRGERLDHSLQTTALVHEAWMRLGGNDADRWEGRAHFFGAAAEAMRRVLVDHARRRDRVKRGGGLGRLPLDGLELVQRDDPAEVLAVDDALSQLEQLDERLGQVVRLRFWAGLEEKEVAALLQLSDRTVRRDWKLARAWLERALQPDV